MKLNSIPLREKVPLQQRKVAKKSLGQSIGVVIFGLIAWSILWIVDFSADEEDIAAVLTVLVPIALVAVPILVGLLIVWIVIYEYLYWKRYHYDIDEKTITIRKGVIAQKAITLPFNRITDVYVDQDLLDVMFGLYDVHISTPTAESGQFAHIDGIDKEGSDFLRDLIVERINRE